MCRHFESNMEKGDYITKNEKYYMESWLLNVSTLNGYYRKDADHK